MNNENEDGVLATAVKAVPQKVSPSFGEAFKNKFAEQQKDKD